jgi:hypothetical protein
MSIALLLKDTAPGEWVKRLRFMISINLFSLFIFCLKLLTILMESSSFKFLNESGLMVYVSLFEKDSKKSPNRENDSKETTNFAEGLD